MNLIGKLFTVIVLIASIMFMMAAVAVYATHRNWKDLASAKQQEVTRLRGENQQLQDDIEKQKTSLAHERAARTMALARLDSQVQEKQQQFDAKNQQYNELLAKERQATDAVLNAQRQLEQVTAQIKALEGEVRTSRNERDQQFQRVTELTDQMHQAEGTRRVLEQRLQKINEDFASATRVLKAHDLSVSSPVDNLPPKVRGEVVSVGPDMIEVSIGEDDGLKPGHTIVVSRNDKYLARAEITRVTPDRAVGRIQYRNAPIQEGDRVQTKAEIR